MTVRTPPFPLPRTPFPLLLTYCICPDVLGLVILKDMKERKGEFSTPIPRYWVGYGTSLLTINFGNVSRHALRNGELEVSGGITDSLHSTWTVKVCQIYKLKCSFH